MCTFLPASLLANDPSKRDWNEIEVMIFKQRDPEELTPAHLILNPKKIDAEKLAFANIKQRQIPVLSTNQVSEPNELANKMLDAGFSLLFSAHWKQPQTKSNHKPIKHNFVIAKIIKVEPNNSHPSDNINTSDQHIDPDQNLHASISSPDTETQAHSAVTRPAKNSIAGLLSDYYPSLTNADEFTVATTENPHIRGALTLQSDRFYEVNLNVYYYENEDQTRPSYLWKIKTRMRKGQVVYLDHPQLACLIKINSTTNPTAKLNQDTALKDSSTNS